MVCSVKPFELGRITTMCSRWCMVSFAIAAYPDSSIAFISNLYAFTRRHVVRGVEVQRIHFAKLYELQDLHDARRGRLNLVELFFGEEHVLIFFVFVALDDFRALDDAVVGGTEQGLLNARVAFLVELVEADPLATRRRGHPHGNRN